MCIFMMQRGCMFWALFIGWETFKIEMRMRVNLYICYRQKKVVLCAVCDYEDLMNFWQKKVVKKNFICLMLFIIWFWIISKKNVSAWVSLLI